MENIKPILRWPGAKWRIAQWIINHFPEHGTYLEPFFGGGAVFFTKPPSGTETINDIDDNIINLFRVIREHSYELVRLIECTPYAKAEYECCRRTYKTEADDIERARKYLVAVWQDLAGRLIKKPHGRTIEQILYFGHDILRKSRKEY